jgi:hypothetical protein
LPVSCAVSKVSGSSVDMMVSGHLLVGRFLGKRREQGAVAAAPCSFFVRLGEM